tara:strand:- start:276 stop:497 length:222 start_codon:yes stop_codon:yes gene_type:complete
MKYNHIKLAIDLVTDTYNITEPFEIQEKIEEDLDMEIHINDILKHLKINKNYENTTNNINNNIHCNSINNYNM